MAPSNGSNGKVTLALLRTLLLTDVIVSTAQLSSDPTHLFLEMDHFVTRCPQRLSYVPLRRRVILLRGGKLIRSATSAVNLVAVLQPDLQTQSEMENLGSSITTVLPSALESIASYQPWTPWKMYTVCIFIVTVWIMTGTLFYSFHNNWPMAQSFFYAVDAGMSIGFCTDVREETIGSRAFTIIYIVLGASCVGGALALFIQNAMMGVASTARSEYRLLLERNVFQMADQEKSGFLSYGEFDNLLRSHGYAHLSEDDMKKICIKFDLAKDGVIHLDEFIQQYPGIETLINTSHALYSKNRVRRKMAHWTEWLRKGLRTEHRIFIVFTFWMILGVSWGIIDQKWDVITATHFAVSALATGGLTAPPVNENGIMPWRPAVFCGMYCLIGIPIFALTLGHFARVLVEGHVVAAERSAFGNPIRADEFELAKNLCTSDSVMHLSDYIVLQLLRQGKIAMDTVTLLKRQFDSLDVEGNGMLKLQQATKVTLP